MIIIVKNYPKPYAEGGWIVEGYGRLNRAERNSRGSASNLCVSTGGSPPALLDTFESQVLKIARHFFQAFSDPESQAWVNAFGQAERSFPVPFGATIGHAILIAINEVRFSRRGSFQFECPGSLAGEHSMTDAERYFILILHHVRRADRTAARAHALFLCEGNDTSRVLAAFERLAVITGDAGDLHFN